MTTLRGPGWVDHQLVVTNPLNILATLWIPQLSFGGLSTILPTEPDFLSTGTVAHACSVTALLKPAAAIWGRYHLKE
jgi:hypothetical protein